MGQGEPYPNHFQPYCQTKTSAKPHIAFSADFLDPMPTFLTFSLCTIFVHGNCCMVWLRLGRLPSQEKQSFQQKPQNNICSCSSKHGLGNYDSCPSGDGSTKCPTLTQETTVPFPPVLLFLTY